MNKLKTIKRTDLGFIIELNIAFVFRYDNIVNSNGIFDRLGIKNITYKTELITNYLVTTRIRLLETRWIHLN